MAFQRDTRIIPRYCDECKKQCRKVELYATLGEVKNRQLCADCFWKWVGIENPNKKPKGDKNAL